jgi:peptidoglycan/xylan/chitin deacetylase (PgdA/CDA1 family)
MVGRPRGWSALLFGAAIVAGLVFAPKVGTAPAAPPPPAGKEIAVTFDDLPMAGPAVGLRRMRAARDQLLRSAAAHRMPLVGFVNEEQLYLAGEVDARIALLQSWVDAGQELGNHTFSHPSLQETPLRDYEEDVVRGETVTRRILAAKGWKLRYFRHPFLRTGPTLEVRAAFEEFLRARGYTVAPVTVDTNDYVFAAIYADRRTRGDRPTMRRVREAYLRYTAEMFDFCEAVSTRLFGRQIRQVFLLHANELNADCLDELARLQERRGYRFVPLERALADPAYASPDRYAGPVGATWLYRWDVTRGKQIDWRKEPGVPAFVQELFDRRSRR